ncbi:four helix bundle protein [Oscillatoria sp. FACHB-1406]|uniref:four helix bundle protein n=1 Tax=Oscillatoria sp. FACHB-1406 TaxID=2692846 RepID=UPI0016879219|nr:four helix bundle protein [Oscillatoria sp. FACHB-1406]MBD2576744.1 four helix bundle protein [Oscillatoria sp. FACHB-1406]
MGKSVVKEKSFAFAMRSVKLYQYLTEEKKEYVLSKQVLKSGTAIGALVREAEQAESKADFIHKFAIALKEAHETEYWLELLHQSSYMNDRSFQSISSDLTELLKLITSIVKKAKENRAMES